MEVGSPSPSGSSPAGQPEPAPPFAFRTDGPPVAGQPLLSPGCHGGPRAVLPKPLPTPRAPRPGPRPAHPPPQMSHLRLRTEPCRPGRSLAPGSRYFGQTPRPPCPSAGAPELQARGGPRGPRELPPRQSAPVPPSLSPLPPRGSPTSPGAALSSNSLGRLGPPRGD